MVAVSAAAAPLNGKITDSDPLHGNLLHHSYMMTGEEGQHLRVSMNAVSFAPRIVVQHPSGEVVGSFSGGGPGETVDVDLRITDSGGWLVMAMGTEPGQTGAYVLDLDMASAEQMAITSRSSASEPDVDDASPLPPMVDADPVFCDAIKQFVATAPGGFGSIRGEVVDDGRRWESRTSIPGALSTDIVKISGYSAVSHLDSSDDRDDIVAAFNEVAGKLRSCLGWKWTHAPGNGIDQYFVGASGPVSIAVSLTEIGGELPYTLVMSVDAD
jgi:hypothetical protein